MSNTNTPPPRDKGAHSAHSLGPPAEHRGAVPSELAGCLRAVLGLAPDEPAPGELAASRRRPLPSRIERLDAGAWIAWCLVGLPLFEERLPPLRVAKASAGRVVVALAMLYSSGSISGAAERVGSTRKVLRDNLRRAGLYPWGGHETAAGPNTTGDHEQIAHSDVIKGEGIDDGSR